MKARVYNHIRKSLYKKRLEQITPSEKVKLFDEIFEMNHTTHWELNSYKQKRKEKAAIHKARVERGYKFKKKTSLKEFQVMSK